MHGKDGICGNPFALFRAASHCWRGASLNAGVSRTSPDTLNRPWFGQSNPPVRPVFEAVTLQHCKLGSESLLSRAYRPDSRSICCSMLSIVLLVNAPMELAVPSVVEMKPVIIAICECVPQYPAIASTAPLRYLAPSRCGVQGQL